MCQYETIIVCVYEVADPDQELELEQQHHQQQQHGLGALHFKVLGAESYIIHTL